MHRTKDGAWKGKCQRVGKQVECSADFAGNVVARVVKSEFSFIAQPSSTQIRCLNITNCFSWITRVQTALFSCYFLSGFCL